jgi:hypothetical protein
MTAKKPFRLRYGVPWEVREIEDGFVVVANDGTHLAYVYGRNPKQPKTVRNALLFTEAKSLAYTIALLPYHPPPDWMQIPSPRGKRGER